MYMSHDMRHRYSAGRRVVNETPRDLGRHIFRRESLKAHLRKSMCLVKDSFHGGLSRISSLTTDHPTAYGMFVMDNTKKNIYCDAPFPGGLLTTR